GLNRRHAVFRGHIDNPVSIRHNLGISDFCAEFEASAGELGSRIQLLRSWRPRWFTAKTPIITKEGKLTASFVPDYTYLAKFDKRPFLVFVEVQNRIHSLTPSASGVSAIKSFHHRLVTHRAFSTIFRGHSAIQESEAFFNIKIEHFVTLVVVVHRTAKHLQNLISIARGKGKSTHQFLFASLDKLQGRNLFVEPVWFAANRQKISLLPKKS
ncbi:MAG: hypothetical protein AAFQ87_04475, partial [Bacteroidota bacterium]